MIIMQGMSKPEKYRVASFIAGFLSNTKIATAEPSPAPPAPQHEEAVGQQQEQRAEQNSRTLLNTVAEVEEDAEQAMAAVWAQARATSAAQTRQVSAAAAAAAEAANREALTASMAAETRLLEAVGARGAAGPPHAAHYGVFVPEHTRSRVHGEHDIRAQVNRRAQDISPVMRA